MKPLDTHKLNQENFNEICNKVNEMYEYYQSINNDVIENKTLKIDTFEGTPTSRNYKVYPSIQNDFKLFCEKHREFKVQDLISQALKEFINKYDSL